MKKTAKIFLGIGLLLALVLPPGLVITAHEEAPVLIETADRFTGGTTAESEAQSPTRPEEKVEHGSFAITFLWIAVVLLAAKMSGFIERWGQPSVLGELIVGVALGNVALLGITFFEPIKHDGSIAFLKELGVVILLFQIGLESNIGKMRKVGARAFLVATVGVIAPFVLGTYVVGPALLPGLSANAYLFLGAALTATSVGITARVFRDLGKLQTPEAQIVLGAAVIDDVMGLVVLAVISAIVTVGAVSVGAVGLILGKAVFFLVGSIALGTALAPHVGRMFSKIHTGTGMKFAIAVSFALVFSFLAQKIGLAPIVGAFAAGLVLDAVHFKFFREPEICADVDKAVAEAPAATQEKVRNIMRRHADKHVEELIEPVAHLLVPIFFVVTGMEVDLSTLFNLPVLLTALGITFVAFVGKIVSGLAAGKTDKWIVGFGMVPRGEVGLIFATMGRALGVISPEVFSVVVIMVILTTLLTPPVLAALLRRVK